MNPADQILFDKIKRLSPQRVAQLEDFVDFLRAREQREVEAGSLTEAFAKLNVPAALAISEDKFNVASQVDRQGRPDSFGKT